MKQLFITTLFLSFQSIWVDDVIDELDTALGKSKTTVSRIGFYSFKSTYHQDAILVNGISKIKNR
jgi:hypothetical protein